MTQRAVEYEVRGELGVSGDAPSLSPQQSLVLIALSGGRATVDQVLGAVRAEGATLSRDEVANALEGLVRARLVTVVSNEPAPPTRFSGITHTRPLEAHQVLPAFRSDLKLEHQNGGLYKVTDPVSAKSFQIYDFEVTLARLLNGRRTAGELVESGVRLGVPVNLNGLEKFVRQMRAYGFLTEGVEPTEQPGTWEPRESWNPAIRDLYQSGVRLVRVGRMSEARGYFEALLELDPRNERALEMLDRTLSTAETETAAPRWQGRRLWLLGGAAGGLIVLALSVAFALRADPDPDPPARPLASKPAPPVEPPKPQVPGAAPAKAGAVEPVAEPPPPAGSSEASVERRWHPVGAELKAPSSGKLRWLIEGSKAVRAKEAIAEIVSKSADAAPRAVSRLKESITRFEGLAREDPVYQAFARKERDKLRALTRGKEARRKVLAPVAGRLRPSTAASDAVSEGDSLGEIVDEARWWVSARFASPPSRPTGCELTSGSPGQSAACEVVTSSPSGEALEVTASVAAKDAPWLDATAPLRLSLTPAAP